MNSSPQKQASEEEKPRPIPPGKGGVCLPAGSQFKKGESGNPGGRPKGADIRAAIRRRLAKNKDEDGIGELAGELADVALDMAMGIVEGKPVQADMVKWATDAACGKLTNKVETTDANSTITLVDEEEERRKKGSAEE